jgi:hypothetical protein
MRKSFRSFFVIVLIIGQSLAKAQPCSLTVSGGTAVCAGFQTTLTAFGANSYTWGSITFSAPVYSQSVPVGPGTYTIMGDTPSCSLIVTVVQQAPLNIQVTQSSATTCLVSNRPVFSKPVIFTAQGASSYAWFSSVGQINFPGTGTTITARPPASSCYTVIGMTSVCSGSAIVCLTVIPQFTITVIPAQAAICQGESIQLAVTQVGQFASGPPSAFTFSWEEIVPSLNNNFSPTVIASPASSSIYTVAVLDANNCISAPVTSSVTVNVCTDVTTKEVNRISFFPNPFNAYMEFKPVDVVLIQISNAQGKLVMVLKPGTEAAIIVDTSLLLPGIYFVSLTNSFQQVLSTKVIKY